MVNTTSNFFQLFLMGFFYDRILRELLIAQFDVRFIAEQSYAHVGEHLQSHARTISSYTSLVCVGDATNQWTATAVAKITYRTIGEVLGYLGKYRSSNVGSS